MQGTDVSDSKQRASQTISERDKKKSKQHEIATKDPCRDTTDVLKPQSQSETIRSTIK